MENQNENILETKANKKIIAKEEANSTSKMELIEPKDLIEAKQRVVKDKEVSKEDSISKQIDAPKKQKPISIKFDKTNEEKEWKCVGVTDLGAPCMTCENCNFMTIRYVHHMEHKDGRQLDVGCVCAGELEGDKDNSKNREIRFKSYLGKLQRFIQKEFEQSKNGNLYLKYKERLLVIVQNKKTGKYKYSIDSIFCDEKFENIEELKKHMYNTLNIDNIL